MKRVVIRYLSADLQELISTRMKEENCGPSKAVVAILEDAAIDKMVEHDVAILRDSLREDEPEPDHRCCGHVQITVRCDQHW